MITEVADIASYQDESLKFMLNLSRHAESIIVKLTEGSESGSKYVNPKAGNQLLNGLSIFRTVGVYHYFRGNSQRYGKNDPVNEAKWFLKQVHAMGLNTDTVLALDVEDQSLQQYVTGDVNLFLDYLYKNGYHHLIVYAPASWFVSGRIQRSKLNYQVPIWVASYGSSQPGVDNANAWQYTNNGYGMHVDFSLCFDSALIGS